MGGPSSPGCPIRAARSAVFAFGGVAAWLALIKFRYHVTFVTVICGALLFAPHIDARLALRLLLLYACFNVLLYGGIYTWNDIADRAADARHPRKRRRPIAAGTVSVGGAAIYATALIVAALTLAMLLFSRTVVACFLVTLVFNGFYSAYGRNLRYLDVVLNSVTHPTRFLVGTLLVERTPPLTHLAALLLLAVALSCLRRDVERNDPGWEARETLRLYSPRDMPCMAAVSLLMLAALAAACWPEAPGFYSIVVVTAAIAAVGGWIDAPVRWSLRRVWTH